MSELLSRLDAGQAREAGGVSARCARKRVRRYRAECQITETLGMALSTVSGVLTRVAMGRLGRFGLDQLYATSDSGQVS
jgi:hypothetical protein